jgi:putative flippase GtrA
MRVFLESVLVTKTQNGYIQFFRYGFVSMAALAVDFAGLVILKEYAHLNYLVAASVSFLAGLGVNYALSTRWVFRGSRPMSQRYEFLLFALIGLAGLGMTDTIMWILTSGLGLFYALSKVTATVTVYFWNFGARKKLIFN